jgi:hypothetical protein
MGELQRQAVTYLLHFVERRLVYSKLFKVILRGLNHLVDDLLVDSALDVAVSQWCLPLPICRSHSAWGQLTTIVFDMVAPFPLAQLSSIRYQGSQDAADACDSRSRAGDGYRRQDQADGASA